MVEQRGYAVAADAVSTATVIVVAGPTASGKSTLALDLAEALDGVVINADSQQVYRDLRILSARPEPEAERRVPHRLYGILDGSQRCSAGRWRAMALAEIAAARSAQRVPIVVGGTGLYLRALTGGIVDVPEIPDAVRSEALDRLRRLGAPAFHRDLAARDPVMAGRLQPTDSQRLIRAWEVVTATGRSLDAWQRSATEAGPAAVWALVMPDRPTLYAACNARFLAMVEAGAIDEVRALAARQLDPSLPVMKALGAPELRAFLAGTMGRDEAVARAQQSTRRYAKRQSTWLRTQVLGAASPPPIEVVIQTQYSNSMRQEILSKFRLGH